jgi:hypothetical protein
MLLLPTRHTALVVRKQSNITVTDRTVRTLTIKIFNIIYLFNYYITHYTSCLCYVVQNEIW